MTDIAIRLRQTRADMIGADAERGAVREMCDFADALLRKEDPTICILRNLLARLS